MTLHLIRSIVTTLAVAALLLAAAAPVQAVPLTPEGLKTWLAQLAQYSPDDGDKGGPPDGLVAQLNDLNDSISGSVDIQTFRNLAIDNEVVRSLLPYASSNFSETRIPATLVLGNVVDNTNVCYVVAYLLKNPGMNSNGRFNLLQVVLQVSTYANPDTERWIRNLVALESGAALKGMDRTATLLKQITDTLDTRKLGQDRDLIDWAGDSYDRCVVELSPLGADIVLGAIEGESLNSLQVEAVRARLFSADRRKYVQFLADGYPALTDPDKASLVTTLLDTIIPQGTDGERRYRVNLYVALAFSKLPKVDDGIDLSRLVALRETAEYEDPTFKQNVEHALARQQR